MTCRSFILHPEGWEARAPLVFKTSPGGLTHMPCPKDSKATEALFVLTNLIEQLF